MIAQTKAELLKIRSTRTTIGLVLGMIALILLFSLLSGLLTKAPNLDERGGPARAAERRQPRRRLLGARRDHARDQRVPLRHDPPDVPVHAQALARARGQARGRPARRPRLRRRRRGARLRDRLRLPLRRAASPFALDGGQTSRCSCSARSPASRSGARSASGSARSSATRSAAIIGLLAWGFVVENLLFAFVPSVGRFAPVHAQDALIGLTTEHLLPAAAGGAVLARLDDRARARRHRARRAPRRQLADRQRALATGSESPAPSRHNYGSGADDPLWYGEGVQFNTAQEDSDGTPPAMKGLRRRDGAFIREPIGSRCQRLCPPRKRLSVGLCPHRTSRGLWRRRKR